MSERPILFSGAMVRAILQGQKQQTRRAVVPQPEVSPQGNLAGKWLSKPLAGLLLPKVSDIVAHCPYGKAGDLLWVRENGWQRPERTPRMMREGADTWAPYYYDADITEADHAQFKEWGFKRRPSIHMPRRFCRLVLEVTAVRVERLEDISEADAVFEGIEPADGGRAKCAQRGDLVHDSARSAYRCLWDSLNDKRGSGWATNPWVWAISFRRVEALKAAA